MGVTLHCRKETMLGAWAEFMKTQRASYLNAAYLGHGLTCPLGLTNNLLDAWPTEG